MDDIVIPISALKMRLSDYLSQEWLEPNRLGGYASSTIVNCHTRKYHGLLVAETMQPRGKFVLLSQLQEELLWDDKKYSLNNFKYQNYSDTEGFNFLHEFRYTSFPIFSYQFSQGNLIKKVMMPEGHNTVLVSYEIINSNSLEIEKQENQLLQLRIRPLLAMRELHHLMSFNSYVDMQITEVQQGIVMTLYKDMPRLYLQINSPFEFITQPTWYYQFEYECEMARGYLALEDLFSPGIFIINMSQKEPIIFSASLEEQYELQSLFKHEQQRRQHLVSQFTGDHLQQRLQYSARSFLKILPDKQLSVIAGYHWFSEWGRDAMISLPGLTLPQTSLTKLTSSTHAGEECLKVLRYFSQEIQNGLIPNFIDIKSHNNSYATVDASLWFAWAVQQYWYICGNLTIIRDELWPALCTIFENYQQGTRFNIHLTDIGLIWAGSSLMNMTWMDAVIDGVPVTPRYGYQVEINALWYNFLGLMHELATVLHDSKEELFHVLFLKAESAFCKIFLYSAGKYLYDYVNEKESNLDIRPNQIFALSLPYTPLNQKQGKEILNVVKQHLYTPYGLRTLSWQQEGYQSSYEGDQTKRDLAYHQGTVWPWLLGHFATALLRFDNHHDAYELIQQSKKAFVQHLSQYGIGSIAEVFNGSDPQKANGCISQAWSVAEVLRMLQLLQPPTT